MTRLLLLLALTVVSISSYAQEPAAAVLTFQAWKEQQILDAQNQTLRISARISQLKAAKPAQSQDTKQDLPTNSKFKKAEMDPLAAAEKDLRRSQESLQIASLLTLEDYATIYIPTLAEKPEDLQTLATKLSKEEMAEILKSLVKSYPSTRDAKRNSGLASEALNLSSKPKSL